MPEPPPPRHLPHYALGLHLAQQHGRGLRRDAELCRQRLRGEHWRAQQGIERVGRAGAAASTGEQRRHGHPAPLAPGRRTVTGQLGPVHAPPTREVRRQIGVGSRQGPSCRPAAAARRAPPHRRLNGVSAVMLTLCQAVVFAGADCVTSADLPQIGSSLRRFPPTAATRRKHWS